MGSVLNKNSMRISRNPEFFVSGLIKPGKKTLGIADLSFFDQITGKYRHAASFIKTSLYYLYFPKQVNSLKKNLSINFFIHSHFRIRPKINLHFEVSRRSHDKARGGRIASYLTDEQRSHAEWIGASKYEVIFGRVLNIFPAIVKNIGYFHLNLIENRQKDIFLTKISNLSKAPIEFNPNIGSDSQQLAAEQGPGLALGFKPLILLPQPVLHFQNIATRAVKKLSEIRHKNTPACALHADRKAQKHKIRPEDQIANILFRDTSFFTYLRLNPISNRTDKNIAEKQSKSMQNLVASKATESEKKYISISHSSRGPSLVNSYLQNPRNKITIPPVLLNVRGHIFAKRSATGRQARLDWINHILPAPESDTGILFVSDFLRDGRNRLKFYEKQSYQRSKRYRYGGVKYFFKSYLTEFPVIIASGRRKIFNLYDNITSEKQLNISKETIAQPISLIPFDKTATLIADLPPLPAVFSKLTVMRENPLLEAKDADSHPKKRARKQPIGSDTAHLNIMKNINFDKKSINRIRYIPFSDYNFTYRFPDKANNNPPSPEGSISTQKPSKAGYRNKFPDMTYFSSNRSPHSTDMAGSAEGKKKTEFLKVDSSYKTDHTKLLSVPGPDLYGLADKVYDLIVERIKRERELRGR